MIHYSRIFLIAWMSLHICACNADNNAKAKEMQTDIPNGYEFATIGGGCFWCIEAVFEQIEGVHSAVSGYMGGHLDNPSYKEVCSGESGHAEVVQIVYDPEKISYNDLLTLFWKAHDPTTLNRQGADVGTQYRSVIYYHNMDQKNAGMQAIKNAQKHFSDKIITEVSEASKFYVAEVSHQDYYKLNPNAGYCRAVIAPKLKKLGLEH